MKHTFYLISIIALFTACKQNVTTETTTEETTQSTVTSATTDSAVVYQQIYQLSIDHQS